MVDIDSQFKSAAFIGPFEGVNPDGRIPQVVFWGRSNVGKSSLINSLARRKNLVKTSKKPGCTQSVNFFSVGSLMYLVDLPGYGYATAGKSVSNLWLSCVKEYLHSCSNSIAMIFLLIESSAGVKDADQEALDFLDHSGLPYQFLITKIDKVGYQKEGIVSLAKGCIGCSKNSLSEVIMMSIKDSCYVSDLRRVVLGIARGFNI